jgi:DNA-binding transcriptional regulator YiaG
VTEAALFRRRRKALGLSQPAMARALLITQGRTIRRWEQDEQTISAPALAGFSVVRAQDR